MVSHEPPMGGAATCKTTVLNQLFGSRQWCFDYVNIIKQDFPRPDQKAKVELMPQSGFASLAWCGKTAPTECLPLAPAALIAAGP